MEWWKYLLIFWILNSAIVSMRNTCGFCKALYNIYKDILILISYIVFGLLIVLVAFFAIPILILSPTKLKPVKIKIEDLRPGDIILTGSNKISLLTIIIKLANILTNGMESKYWTHVAFHIGEGVLIEAQPTNVREIPIQDYIDKHSLIKVFRHKYLNSTNNFAVMDEIVQNCKNIYYYKDKYGSMALIYYGLSIGLPNIFNWAFNDSTYDKFFNVENRYFCSELAAEAYSEAGHPISELKNWRVKPSDFLRNPLFHDVTTEVSEKTVS